MMGGIVMKMFKSDNTSGVHPKIMEAIIDANEGYAHAYGEDETTKKAEGKIRELLGCEADVFFVTTGTAANVIGLMGLLRNYEGIVAAETAHINVDECGAMEKFAGNKIIQVPNREGKISIDDIEPLLEVIGDEHSVQPRVISISQTTEMGTLYTVEEIRALVDFAHENNMLLHVDGARIANAVEALGTTLKEMITDTGVDLLSFGGTKNGMMMGEAIVSLKSEFGRGYLFHRKQGMQLVSKMRYISAQFIAYLEDDLWIENARNANQMGKYLAERISGQEGVGLYSPVSTNMVFAFMDKGLIEHLLKNFKFYVTDPSQGQVRFVTSYDITKEDVDEFVEYIIRYNNK
jgi:threonine aldolase